MQAAMNGGKPAPWLGRVLVLLAVIAAAVLLIGFDRIPRLPLDDEPFTQDPALALAAGQGMVSPMFAGTVLDQVFANYPPLYILVQAAIYTVVELSVWSMRLPNLVFHFAALLLLFRILMGLHRQGWLGPAMVVIIALMAVFEMNMVALARWARAEPLLNLLGIAAVAALLPLFDPARKAAIDRWRWWAASVLMGGALACHPTAAWDGTFFLIALTMTWRERSMIETLALAAVAGLICPALWVLTYGENSLEAVRIFLGWGQMMSYRGVPLGIWIDALASGQLRTWTHWGGGMVLVVVLVAWASLALAMGLRNRIPRLADAGARRVLYLLAATAAAHLVLTYAVLGMSITRLYGLYFLALISLAVALPLVPIGSMALRRAALALIAAVQVAGGVSYIYKGIHEWAARDPGTHRALVASLPADARVAASHHFWFEFRRQNRPYRLAPAGEIPFDGAYWQSGRNVLASYDVVIIDESNIWAPLQPVTAWPSYPVPAYHDPIRAYVNPAGHTPAWRPPGR